MFPKKRNTLGEISPLFCCRSDENKKAYNAQRNRCVKLAKNARKAHYSNLNFWFWNLRFWKVVKLLFSEKVTMNENITLVDNSNTISSNIEIVEKLNTFFSNIIKELNVKVKEDQLGDMSNIKDPVERAIQKHKNDPSIQMIKETFDNIKKFHLTYFIRHNP